MKPFFALFKRELHGYIYSLLSYLFIIVFLVLLSWMFWRDAFVVGQTSMRGFFALLPWFFLFLLPALSMRLWSEEKKTGTIEKLLTFPITDRSAVLAKFAAAAVFLAGVLTLSLPMPITLSRIGSLDWGPVIGAYIGAWLLGCGILSMGQWVSSLTKNQIVAFLITIAASFGFMLIGFSSIASGGEILLNALRVLSTQTHFDNMAKGVIDLRDVVYSLTFIVFFLYLNTQTLAKRKSTIRRGSASLFLLAAAVAANMLVSSAPVIKLDLTEEKLYTLSDGTKQILGDLENPVTIKIFFSKEVPQNMLAIRQDVHDLASEYERAGQGNVALERLDPMKDDDAVAEAQKFEIPQIQFNVVGNETLEVTQGYAGVALVYGDKNESLPVVENTTTLEYDMTSAIAKMSREKLPKIAFLNGFGEAETTQLEKLLEKQYEIVTVSANDLATTDAKNLVIAGSTFAVGDRDQYQLDQFLMKGGRVFALVDGRTIDDRTLETKENTTGIIPWLEAYGIKVNTDLVRDFASAQPISQGDGPFTFIRPYPFWPIIVQQGFSTQSPITEKLKSLVLPWASSIVLSPKEGMHAIELAKTSPQSQSVSEPLADPNDDTLPPENELASHVVAGLVTGKFTSAFAEKDKPKDVDAAAFVQETQDGAIFVLGDADAVADKVIGNTRENALIVLNAVDVLNQEASLADARGRSALSRPLMVLSEKNKTIIRYGNTFSAFALVLVVSLAASFARRRKQKKILRAMIHKPII